MAVSAHHAAAAWGAGPSTWWHLALQTRDKLSGHFRRDPTNRNHLGQLLNLLDRLRRRTGLLEPGNDGRHAPGDRLVVASGTTQVTHETGT